MLSLPTIITRNIAFIDGKAWAFYRIVPYSYSSLSMEQKRQEWWNATQFFKQAQASFLHAQLWMVRCRFNWEDYLERLVQTVSIERQPFAKKSMYQWGKLINDYAKSSYEFIVAFELSQPLPKKYSWIVQTFGFPIRLLEVWLGLKTKIHPEDREAALEQCFDYSWSKKGLEDRTQSLSYLDPLQEWEIADFYRHHFSRGLEMQPLTSKMRSLWPTGFEDYTWLAEGVRTHFFRYVSNEQEKGTRLYSFISVSSIPDVVDTPGTELFFGLTQCLDFPIEATIRWRMIPYQLGTRWATKKKMEIKDSSSHVNQVDHLSLDLWEQQGLIDKLEFELKKHRPPILESRLVFCVDGEDEQQVKNRSEQVVQALDRYGVMAARPTGEQGKLFSCWLPSTKWPATGYVKKMLPEVASALIMPGAMDLLGDPNGVPIGFSQRGTVVKMNPERGPQINRNASMVITGTLGSGKSHTLNNLIHKTALFWDARIFLIDPKGERSHWVGTLPGLENRVQVLRLDGRQNSGALDPFQLLAHDIDFAVEIAVSVIGQFERNMSREDKNRVLSAAEKMIQSFPPSMFRLVEILAEERGGWELGQYLQRVARLPLGSLIFGQGKSLSIPDNGIVLLQLDGLDLPHEKQKPNGLRQEASVEVMSMTAILAEQFVLRGKKGGFRVAALDEAWIWLRSEQGKTLANRLERAGRSQNAGIWFATQNPSDVDSEILNNASVYICLGTSDELETTLAIQALSLDPDDENIRKHLQSRRSQGQSGTGFMKDLDGRSGWVQFVTPEVELLPLFNTKPMAGKASMVAEEGHEKAR